MKCPSCNTELRQAERQGIAIDHCPQCRGVWLERGELDKIIERAKMGPLEHRSGATPSASYRSAAQFPKDYAEESDRLDYRAGNEHTYYKKKQQESFLGNLFDFE